MPSARAVLGAILAALLLGPFTALQAQERFGAIVGQVADESGAVLPGVAVSVTNLATSRTIDATTDATGSYAIAGLAFVAMVLQFNRIVSSPEERPR